MSREERRAYERMNKGRDPLAPPVSRQAAQRVERAKQKRATRRSTTPPSTGLGGRFWRVTLIAAVVAALLAFSITWPGGMPNALYVGIAAALAVAGLAFGGRALASRAGARREDAGRR